MQYVAAGGQCLGLGRVVTAEIHRLAHLGHAVAQCLVRLLHQQAAIGGQALVQQITGAAHDGRALGHRAGRPDHCTLGQSGHRGVNVGGGGQGHWLDAGHRHGRAQRRALGQAGDVDTGGVGPRGTVQRTGQRQSLGAFGRARVRQVQW
jgi:hypothetical protein